jgi:hypothetical protein
MKIENGRLMQALTSLIQVVTLILVFYCIQVGLGALMGFILLLIRITQPSGIL